MTTMKHLLLMAIVALLFASCNQKELEYLATGKRYHIDLRATYDKCWHLVYDGGTDWATHWDEQEYLMTYESLMPQDPSGLRVVAYKEAADGQSTVFEYFNFPPSGGVLDLVEGTYSFTLFNNDTERIVLNDIEQMAEATATTRLRSRDSYFGYTSGTSGEYAKTINAPDMLFACKSSSVACNYENDYMVLDYELRPLVYKYLVRYHFSAGMNYITMARGAMCGMAASVYLTDGHTSTERANIMCDIDLNQSRVFSDAEKGTGLIYCVINTFGAPGFPNEYYSRATDTYGLTLEALLTNGTTKSFNIDISSQVLLQPRGGVIDVYDLAITDKDAGESKGAFDVDIDDWGKHTDLDIF